jgi:hypothetical protein
MRALPPEPATRSEYPSFSRRVCAVLMKLARAGMVGPAAGYRFELETHYRTIPTEDRLESVMAFNEKRRPDFKGKGEGGDVPGLGVAG